MTVTTFVIVLFPTVCILIFFEVFFKPHQAKNTFGIKALLMLTIACAIYAKFYSDTRVAEGMRNECREIKFEGESLTPREYEFDFPRERAAENRLGLENMAAVDHAIIQADLAFGELVKKHGELTITDNSKLQIIRRPVDSLSSKYGDFDITENQVFVPADRQYEVRAHWVMQKRKELTVEQAEKLAKWLRLRPKVLKLEQRLCGIPAGKSVVRFLTVRDSQKVSVQLNGETIMDVAVGDDFGVSVYVVTDYEIGLQRELTPTDTLISARFRVEESRLLATLEITIEEVKSE